MEAVQGSKRVKEPLYPVYLVHEAGAGRPIERSGTFLVADVQFRGKKAKLEPSNHSIHFEAYTREDRLFVKVEYEAIVSKGGDHGTVLLFFDRGSTRRKRHNMFVLHLKPDGTLLYEEQNYEQEFLPLPEGLIYEASQRDGMQQATFSIPLEFLRIRSLDDRVIGFNVTRILKDPKDDPNNNLSGDFISWSGIKGDRPSGGIGNGDLLLTRDLSDEEIADWTKRVQAYSSTHYAQWERRYIPDRIHELMAEKKRGFTGRLSREDVQRARRNAETTVWGARMKAEIVGIADYWAAKSDEELFDFVPVGNPRALSVGQFFGNPLHGGKRTAFEVCLERPYEFYSIHTKSWWHVGMTLTHPETGEPVVLEDDGGGFVAPDGFPVPGARYMFIASYRLFLISMLLGTPYCSVMEDVSVCPETTGSRYAGAIPNLAFAYHLTGDPAYARKALILLGRLGELIPYMNGNYGSGYYDTVQIAEPTTTECHWLSNYFDSFDLLYDSIGELGDAVAAVFASKPDAEGRPRRASFDLKAAVHDMIPFVLYSCEIERTRNADWSLRYIYLELLIASFMQSGRLMHEVLNVGDYCLKAKVRNNFFRDGRYIYDSLGYIVQICDQVTMMANNNYGFRDGTYFPDGIDMFENAEFGISQVIRLYSRLYCGNLTPMFGDTLADNREPLSADRTRGKFKYSPAFEISFARMPSLRDVLGPVLAEYDAEELAAYRVNSMWLTNVKHSLLLLASASNWEDYQPYKAGSRGIQPSFLVEDSETSVLRAGTNAHNCKHVVMYGQPSAGHKHGDKLGLWIAGYGYHLFSPIGSYPFTWLSPKFDAWEIHSAACTVVVVDGRNQAPSYSRQRCHYEGRLLQVTGMENTIAYPGTHYERWAWLVKAPDGADAYVVDLNYVENGSTFDYHTMGMDISFDDVVFEGTAAEADGAWQPLSGTLAGPGVELYSEPGHGWMQALRQLTTDQPVGWTYRYAGAALKVHTAPEPGERREIVCALGERGGEEMRRSRWEPMVIWRDRASVESGSGDTSAESAAAEASAAGTTVTDATAANRAGATGAASAASGTELVAGLAALQVPDRGDTAAAPTGADTHRAVFAAVLEPYEHRAFLSSVRRLTLLSASPEAPAAGTASRPYKPVGMEIVHADGVHRDIVIAGYAVGVMYRFADADGVIYETDARALLLRYREGSLIEVEAIGYTLISDGMHRFEAAAPAYTGQVVAVDLDERRIEVELEDDGQPLSAEELAGHVALIDSPDYDKPSTYYVHEPQLEGRRLTFQSGMSLIRLDADWKQPFKRMGLGRKSRVTHGGREVLADVKTGDTFRLWNRITTSL
ncbi:hypothetical protein [Paenibacillus sp. HJGM_3]|uniref:hypothetical protein n=1 Tax=Paenibacillus sp. HJGM_3 TaxID=3379816 RepID=UPI00385C9E60